MRATKKSIANFLAGKHSEEEPIWERILERCRHEREIVRVYGSEMRPRSDQPFTGRLVVVLVFTNRSGSNFLCDCLRATGKFELAGEALNWEIVATSRVAIPRLSAYTCFRTKTASQCCNRDRSG